MKKDRFISKWNPPDPNQMFADLLSVLATENEEIHGAIKLIAKELIGVAKERDEYRKALKCGFDEVAWFADKYPETTNLILSKIESVLSKYPQQ